MTNARIDTTLLRKLWPFVRPVRRLVLLTFVASVVASFAQVLQPYLLKRAIDGPIASGKPRELVTLAILFFCALLLELTLQAAQLYLSNLAGQDVTRRLRSAVYSHTLARPIAFFSRNPTGKLITRITNDPEAINELFASGAVSVLTDIVKMLVIVSVMLALDWRLTLVAFLLMPMLAGMTGYFRKRVRDAYRGVRTAIAKMATYLQESLMGISVIRIFQREPEVRAAFDDRSRRYRDEQLRSVVFESFFSALVELVGSLAAAILLFAGGYQFLSGITTLGTLVAFLDYTQKFYAPLREMSAKYTVMQAAMAAVEKIWTVLDETDEIKDPDSPVPWPERFSLLAFENVSFRYRPGSPEAVSNLSFRIERGEKVALVGATGSGKSTIARLMIRLHNPNTGRITIDDTDIRSFRKVDLRRNVTMLLQETHLFAGDIRTNITLGEPVADLDAVLEASQFQSVLRRLPHGLDTILTERGANLSAGERQLLGLARALALSPPVLVLDEATASIDPEVERHIQAALRSLLEGRTALIIAHRLSTIRDADRILVLSHGRIEEQGTHEDLLAAAGLYARLYRMQEMRATEAA